MRTDAWPGIAADGPTAAATAPRPYWEAMVKRVKDVFKAPIADADMPAIVDYLAKTYGNEQPK